jgi:stage V sporulation protein R
MKLIDQHTKKIMEECKSRAKEAGLNFGNETLEYIVTNRDLLELSPKVMIPTLYDYWVHDVEVLKEFGKYKLYPTNPYETVINSQPAISFYNDNNPDWLNIMIFYHVLAHIDFFGNNMLFGNTWNDDFVGQALADKRLIANLRSEYGRWVDYIIEFSRSIDNITGFYKGISKDNFPKDLMPDDRAKYYFDVFLQEEKKLQTHEIYNEIVRYNQLISKNGDIGESIFFSDVKAKYPEFEARFNRYQTVEHKAEDDILEYIRDNSPFLRQPSNEWMKSILTIIRNTSLYFAPQVRSKIINEGWASYWHDKLFRADERIKGHEIAYAKVNAGVTSLQRAGLNPYAIGMRLIQYVEELAQKGKLSYDFQRLTGADERDKFDKNTGKGIESIFELRRLFSDFTLINTFCTQEFTDMHDLYVVGRRYNEERDTIEYFVKSRKAEDYKKMLIDSLYHPPVIKIDHEKTSDNLLYLVHEFESKQLVTQYIPDVLIGIEFLWGGRVQLETTEIHMIGRDNKEKDLRKVLYSVENRRVGKTNL